ncbi:MAG: hypothetical protein J2P26_06785 [Nocardiopsaceae bacterium]|nr:hypothetical protein [Nocardiopsaceae bacterium]
MSADFSVAPEIAQLAVAFVPPMAGPPAPATAGRRAAELTRLAAAPQEWWDLVRFDPGAVVRVAIPAAPAAPRAWLLITPPGAVTSCDCGLATLLAGEAAEDGRPLRPGRVLLHGASEHGYGSGGHGSGHHRLRGSAHGYAVSLHVLTDPIRRGRT